jgi:hypothetical protein
MPSTIDPGEFAHTAEGVDRAEELAAHTMENMITMTGVAQLDTTITSMFLLAEVLAGLQVYDGLSARDAIKRVRHLTAERVAALAETSPPAAPSQDAIPAGARVLH